MAWEAALPKSVVPLVTFDHDPDASTSSLVYTFGGAAPVASIMPGTALSSWTRDCFAGQLTTVSDLASAKCDPRYLNPQTGPFYVEGARPGDTIAVHFVRIRPRYSWGVSATVPYFGALTGTRSTATLQGPLPERTWIYEIDAQQSTVRYTAIDSTFSVDLPLDPMHGTVGVAPALGEVRSALAPGEWGGNLDTPEMRSGTTCFLGVNVEGALLSFGDGHARQGEGEACGVAVECAMDTVLIIELLRDTPTPWPRLQNDDYIMTAGSARPLEDALRIAHVDMVQWVAQLTGLSVLDAYQLVSQAALTPVANAVDTSYTVVVKLPVAVLNGATVFDDIHRSMRRRASQVAELVPIR
jgi:acetamidase/formamidase